VRVRRRRTILIAAGLGVAIQACAPAAPQIVLPTVGSLGTGELTIDGRLELDGLCIHLEGGNGVRSNLLWPRGYAASGPPLEVRSEAGDLVLRAGDEVVLDVADAGIRSAPMGCPPRRTWAVASVSRVNAEAPGTAVPQPTRIPQPPH
jgi:hypothetical protein